MSDDQFGFRRGAGTREAILTLRRIIENLIRKDKTTFLTLVDLEKAFGNVNWNTLFIILRQAGIDYRDRRLIYNRYKHVRGVIRIGSKKEEARIEKDVIQGCSLSPYLFDLYIQRAIDKIRELQMEVKAKWPKIRHGEVC